MYSERDMHEIDRRIRTNLMVLLPVLAALLAAYIWGLAAGVKWLVMAAGPMMFAAACFGFLGWLWPNLRYRRFLRDMNDGLSREMRGTVVAISEAAEPQDGAMVLPVRILLDDAGGEKALPRASAAAVRLGLEAPNEADERIVYLNASKRAGFPGPGAKVALQCYGRHIRQATAQE